MSYKKFKFYKKKTSSKSPSKYKKPSSSKYKKLNCGPTSSQCGGVCISSNEECHVGKAALLKENVKKEVKRLEEGKDPGAITNKAMAKVLIADKDIGQKMPKEFSTYIARSEKIDDRVKKTYIDSATKKNWNIDSSLGDGDSIKLKEKDGKFLQMIKNRAMHHNVTREENEKESDKKKESFFKTDQGKNVLKLIAATATVGAVAGLTIYVAGQKNKKEDSESDSNTYLRQKTAKTFETPSEKIDRNIANESYTKNPVKVETSEITNELKQKHGLKSTGLIEDNTHTASTPAEFYKNTWDKAQYFESLTKDHMSDRQKSEYKDIWGYEAGTRNGRSAAEGSHLQKAESELKAYAFEKRPNMTEKEWNSIKGTIQVKGATDAAQRSQIYNPETKEYENRKYYDYDRSDRNNEKKLENYKKGKDIDQVVKIDNKGNVSLNNEPYKGKVKLDAKTEIENENLKRKKIPTEGEGISKINPDLAVKHAGSIRTGYDDAYEDYKNEAEQRLIEKVLQKKLEEDYENPFGSTMEHDQFQQIRKRNEGRGKEVKAYESRNTKQRKHIKTGADYEGRTTEWKKDYIGYNAEIKEIEKTSQISADIVNPYHATTYRTIKGRADDELMTDEKLKDSRYIEEILPLLNAKKNPILTTDAKIPLSLQEQESQKATWNSMDVDRRNAFVKAEILNDAYSLDPDVYAVLIDGQSESSKIVGDRINKSMEEYYNLQNLSKSKKERFLLSKYNELNKRIEDGKAVLPSYRFLANDGREKTSETKAGGKSDKDYDRESKADKGQAFGLENVAATQGISKNPAYGSLKDKSRTSKFPSNDPFDTNIKPKYNPVKRENSDGSITVVTPNGIRLKKKGNRYYRLGRDKDGNKKWLPQDATNEVKEIFTPPKYNKKVNADGSITMIDRNGKRFKKEGDSYYIWSSKNNKYIKIPGKDRNEVLKRMEKDEDYKFTFSESSEPIINNIIEWRDNVIVMDTDQGIISAIFNENSETFDMVKL